MPKSDPASLYRLITTEIWCNRRYELVDELIDEDFVDHIEAQGLEGNGRSRYLASLRVVHEAFSDYHEEAEFIVADRDMAVGYARLTGTHDGDLMGLPPTGRKIDVHAIGILRFRDGHLIERWGIGDSLTQMQQLGVFG
jgi:predicted ester cyclase